jgi:hypothetical protein
VAVLGQLRLQLSHARQQRGDLLALALMRGFQFGDAVLGRHAFMLHPLHKFA